MHQKLRILLIHLNCCIIVTQSNLILPKCVITASKTVRYPSISVLVFQTGVVVDEIIFLFLCFLKIGNCIGVIFGVKLAEASSKIPF